MDAKVRELVWERCGGYCEFCGKPLQEDAFDFHHRQLTTKLDLVSNGIAAHHECHLVGIHLHPKIAREQGFIISKYVKQSEFPSVPVLLGGGENLSQGRWVLLENSGIYMPVSVDNLITNDYT